MAKSGSERTMDWRAQLVAQGYKQKALLLSEQAIKDMATIKKRFDCASDAEATALALRQLAASSSNAPAPKKKLAGKGNRK